MLSGRSACRKHPLQERLAELRRHLRAGRRPAAAALRNAPAGAGRRRNNLRPPFSGTPGSRAGAGPHAAARDITSYIRRFRNRKVTAKKAARYKVMEAPAEAPI